MMRRRGHHGLGLPARRPRCRRAVPPARHSGAAVVLALLAWSVPLARAAAPAASSDAAAVTAYLKADARYTQTASANVNASLRSMSAFVHRVAKQCPGATSGQPSASSPSGTLFSKEVLGALLVATVHPNHAAALGFVRAANRLHWHNAKLGQAVRAYLATVGGEAGLAEPNVCADARAWKKSGFRSVSAATSRFVNRFNAVSKGSQEVPPSLLAPYEGPRQRTLARRIKQREREVGERLGFATFASAAELARALG